MRMKGTEIADVDIYIAGYLKDTQKLLKQLRAAVKKIVPDVQEGISYQMPGYKFHGMLLYFAAYRNHIGFYPGTGAILRYKKELSVYNSAKGSVQFPLDKPLPLKLIESIVSFKAKENLEKMVVKSKKRK